MQLEYIKVDSLNDPRITIYSQYKESQLLHYYEPDLGIFIAESPKVITRALQAGYEPLSFLAEEQENMSEETSEFMQELEHHTMGNSEKFSVIHERESDDPIPFFVGKKEMVSHITGFHLTRGLLCAMRRKELPDMASLCQGCRRIAILENVVNPANVGAIFRSAAALNMDAVLLTSACSDPLYRRAARVGMGTVFQVPWTYIGANEKNKIWPHDGLKLIKEMGFKTAAMALSENAVSINDPKLLAEEKLAIILGTEGEGLMEETIRSCDYVVKIPMSHGVDSLNVAAASAVVFWQLGCAGDRFNG